VYGVSPDDRCALELLMHDMTRLYRLLSTAPDWSPDDPRVVELADLVEHLRIRAIQSGELEIGGAEQTDPCTALLDAAMTESSPVARRLLGILEQRGWRGWNRLERIPDQRITRDR
jgi:hypothetical protein